MVKVFRINSSLFFGILDLNLFSEKYQLTNKREIENFGKHHLLNVLLGKEFKIIYDEKGKPYLAGDKRHLSVSHSHDQLAIIINSEEPTGIDIELIRDKVIRVKHKYLSSKELLDAGDDIEKLLIYWAAKETLYKIYGLREIDFSVNLFVNSFTKKTVGNLIGHIQLPHFRDSYELCYRLMKNYVLVYALKKIS